MNHMDSRGQLMPRATVEGIVALRNAALAAYDEAYTALAAAKEAADAAREAAGRASPGRNSYNHFSQDDKKNFLFKLVVADRDDYRAAARQYYEDLEAEYYYQTSDEAVAESLEANEIEIDDVEDDDDEDDDLQEAA